MSTASNLQLQEGLVTPAYEHCYSPATKRCNDNGEPRSGAVLCSVLQIWDLHVLAVAPHCALVRLTPCRSADRREKAASSAASHMKHDKDSQGALEINVWRQMQWSQSQSDF